MAIQRIADLTEPPVVGRYYLVPAIYVSRGEYQAKRRWWPIIGPKHDDIEHFDFHYEHFHYDPRFLTREMLSEFYEYKGGAFGRSKLFSALAGPLCEWGGHSFPTPELHRFRCMRAQVIYPFHSSPPIVALNEHWKDKQALRGKSGWICPHRNALIGTFEPDEDGIRERFARALYFAAEGLRPESWYLPENDAHWERWKNDGEDMISPSPLVVADALLAAFPALATPLPSDRAGREEEIAERTARRIFFGNQDYKVRNPKQLFSQSFEIACQEIAAALRQSASAGIAPAEPNPSGSGEPVAWQCRAKLATGELSEWCNLSLYLARREKDQHPDWEFRPLYAAPLPSPSEGAGDEAETIEALRSALKAAGHTTADGTWIAAGTGRVIATILRALRTRATATGGGDNG